MSGLRFAVAIAAALGGCGDDTGAASAQLDGGPADAGPAQGDACTPAPCPDLFPPGTNCGCVE